jgi:hypothetical protein
MTSRRYKNLHPFINCNTRIFNEGQSSTSVTLDTACDWCNLCTMIMTHDDDDEIQLVICELCINHLRMTYIR